MSATTCCSQGGTAFAMTECKQSSFGFQDCGSREIVARFDGGTISSDGGAVLLRQTDHRLDLLPRLAQCFLDGRDQDRVQHSVQEMISQRVYGLALGYEDINDHEQLRSDPLFSVLAGREELEKPLAGKSTLNRLELGDGTEDRYKKITFWKQGIDELLVEVFIESQERTPGDGLCVVERAAAIGAEGDGAGASAGIHDSHQAAEDWCPGASDGAKSLDLDGFQLPVAGPLSAGLGEPALLTRP